MQKIPYWITQNLKSIEYSYQENDLSLFTFEQVWEGKSPLKKLGKDILNHFIITKMSPFKEVFIFPKESIGSEISHKVGQIFPLICRIKNDNALSGHGTISFSNDDESNDYQPPQIQSQDDIHTSRLLVMEEAEENFALSKLIASSPKYSEYFCQLSYLKELRCTDPFLGYLGLWSFIEIEWAEKITRTDIKQSLKNLLEQVYATNKGSKKEFNSRLHAISIKVGASFDERSIRNLLAHGKYHVARNNWQATDNVEFHSIHDKLFTIMFTGLEQKIRAYELLLSSND